MLILLVIYRRGLWTSALTTPEAPPAIYRNVAITQGRSGVDAWPLAWPSPSGLLDW